MTASRKKQILTPRRRVMPDHRRMPGRSASPLQRFAARMEPLIDADDVKQIEALRRVRCVLALRAWRSRPRDNRCNFNKLMRLLRYECGDIGLSPSSLYRWDAAYTFLANVEPIIDHRGGDRKSPAFHTRQWWGGMGLTMRFENVVHRCIDADMSPVALAFMRSECVQVFRRFRHDNPGLTTSGLPELLALFRRNLPRLKVSKSTLYRWNRALTDPQNPACLIDRRGGDHRSFRR